MYSYSAHSVKNVGYRVATKYGRVISKMQFNNIWQRLNEILKDKKARDGANAIRATCNM